jgi:hypothetical protein
MVWVGCRLALARTVWDAEDDGEVEEVAEHDDDNAGTERVFRGAQVYVVAHTCCI